ncbi:MAG: Hsp33 family molecular chaperone HslO [Clostridia bacterium]|nr:Hsp33 family molecular chaperone HslO [Clostridia bacterium]
MSKIWSALVGKNIRVYLAEAKDMTQEACEIHHTSEVSSIAYGRTLIATSLLSKLLKNDQDVLTLKIGGTNQIKTILATADYNGMIKGYISNNDAELPMMKKGKIGEAIGLGGNITVIRDFGLKEPYVGISHMLTAEIDDDIAFYYRNSEQQPTGMKLVVKTENQKILAAGGILIQPLPDATPQEKLAFEKAVEKLSDFEEQVHLEMDPEALLKHYFPDLEIRITNTFDIAFKCDCTRDRIARALLTVGKEELKEILAVDHEAVLKCHFCNTQYRFDENDLADMIQALDEDSHH